MRDVSEVMRSQHLATLMELLTEVPSGPGRCCSVNNEIFSHNQAARRG